MRPIFIPKHCLCTWRIPTWEQSDELVAKWMVSDCNRKADIVSKLIYVFKLSCLLTASALESVLTQSSNPFLTSALIVLNPSLGCPFCLHDYHSHVLVHKTPFQSSQVASRRCMPCRRKWWCHLPCQSDSRWAWSWNENMMEALWQTGFHCFLSKQLQPTLGF